MSHTLASVLTHTLPDTLVSPDPERGFCAAQPPPHPHKPEISPEPKERSWEQHCPLEDASVFTPELRMPGERCALVSAGHERGRL